MRSGRRKEEQKEKTIGIMATFLLFFPRSSFFVSNLAETEGKNVRGKKGGNETGKRGASSFCQQHLGNVSPFTIDLAPSRVVNQIDKKAFGFSISRDESPGAKFNRM